MSNPLASEILDAIANNLSDGLVVIDCQGRVGSINRAAEQILGPGCPGLVAAAAGEGESGDAGASKPAGILTAGSKAGPNGPGVYFSDERTPFPPESLPVARALRGEAVADLEICVRNKYRPEGVHLRVNARPLTAAGGGAVLTFTDLTASKQAEFRDSLFQQVISQTNEAILITDAEERIIFVNQAFTRVTGFSGDEIIGRPLASLRSGLQGDDFMHAVQKRLDREGQWKGEFRNRRKTGEIFPVWANINCVKDKSEAVTNFVAVFTDMSGVKETEDQLYRLTNIDPVTSLPNRKVFFEQLRQTLERVRRQHRKCGIVFLDLERFKELNDSLGHAAGDQFLLEVARVLSGIKRSEDFLARIGGDEYALIIDDLESDLDLALIVEKVIQTLARPIHVGDLDIVPSASIGVAVYPDDGADADTLAKHADTALSAVKESGASGYQFYTQKMNANVVKHFWVESNLRKAVGTDQIVPFFQPQVNLANGLPEEAEVLIRWKHPVRGFIGPGDFIPIAEKTGLIDAVSEQIIDATCRQLKEWRGRSLPIKLLAVNLSARNFIQTQLAEQILGIIQKHSLTPKDLLIEITESAIMTEPDLAAATVKQFKDIGFALAIDDFGTGYSSLSYLQKFKVDQVKIDRSFIIDLATKPESRSIVKAIIAMCSSLGQETLAEGVESEEQLAILRELGCNKIQGYLISKPLPADEFEKFVLGRGR